jgi:hypothetical protein
MAFFTQAIEDGTIDAKINMSEEELKNAIIARILESNAWEIHKRTHKDAGLSKLSDDGGLSKFEEQVVRRSEINHDDPAIQYDSHTKKFVAGCNCGKEKFVFDVKNDTVESESARIHMKGIDPYNKNQNENSYGRESGDGNGYNNKSVKQNPSYNSNSGRGISYKN